MTGPRRVFANTPDDQKPWIGVQVRLEGSCACHFGDTSHGCSIAGGWNGHVPRGHSCCDVMSLACAIRVESELAIDSLVRCMTTSGMSEAEARSEIERNVQKVLPIRRSEEVDRNV